MPKKVQHPVVRGAVAPSPSGAHRNLLLFAPPGSGLRTVAASSVAARLPVGTTAITLPLFALAQGHSAAVAGAAVAGYRLAQAAAGPMWGRAADRLPLPRLFLASGVAYASLVCAIALTGGGTAILLTLSVALGASMLPHGAVMRSFWRRQPDLGDRQMLANAFESFMSEGVLLLGRFVAALLFLVLSPTHLLLAQALVAVGGASALASRSRVRDERRAPRDVTPASRGLQVLRTSAPILLCFLLFSASLGAFSIGLTVRLQPVADGNTWTALAIGVWGLGSLVGVLVLGHRTRRRLRLWFVCLAGAMAVVQLAVVLGSGPVVTSALAFVAGLPIAVAIVCLYGLLEARRNEARYTEQLAWATTAVFVGDALGGAVAGATAGGTSSSAWPIACAAALAVLACAAVGLLRRVPSGAVTAQCGTTSPPGARRR